MLATEFLTLGGQVYLVQQMFRRARHKLLRFQMLVGRFPEMKMTQPSLSWVLLIVALDLMGCSNYFLRKSCESVNWYQHGFDLAMKGVRVSNDDKVVQCRKAEAEMSESQLDQGFKAGMAQYCRPDIVFQTGKKGENLNLDLCDPGPARILSAKHKDGVKEFCEADNGFSVGSSGKIYSKICPPEMEKAFLKEYNRGRKKYLQAMISETMSKSQDLDRSVIDKEQQVRNTQYQISLIPGPTKIVQRTTSPTGFTTEQTAVDDAFADRRRNLEWELGRQKQEADTLRTQQKQAREKIYEYQRELTTLD